MKKAALSVLLTALSVLSGCTSAPYADLSKPLDDAATLQKVTGIEAVKLLPLSPASGSFLPTLTDELEEGKRVGFKFERDGEGWKWTLKKLRVIYYASAPGGTVITREDDLDENVAVTYEPAIPILPNSLVMGSPVKGSAAMVVTDMDDGSIKNRGKCDYVIELLGRQNIWTPRGVIDAVIIRNTRKISLKFVNVDVEITTAYAYAPLAKPTVKDALVGQVGEYVHQVIKPLGLFDVESDEELRIAPDSGKLVSKPKDATPLPTTKPTTMPAAGSKGK